MPQAPECLRAMFTDDAAAFAALGKNYTDDRGMLRPRPGHTPTQHELRALDYLFLEWDYTYEIPDTGEPQQ